MGDPTYPLIPVLASLAFAVTVIPFAYISPVEHAGTCIFMIWEATDCLKLAVNRVLWKGTSANIAPVWCEISTRLDTSIGIGIPASLLCMIYATHCRVNLDVAFNTRQWRRRYLFMTVGVGIGLPVAATVLRVVIVEHRFYILEGCGCEPSYFNTWISYLTHDTWPLLLSLLASYYCVRTILICKGLCSKRMFTSDSPQNRHLFLRALLCVGSLAIFAVPLCIYHLVSRILMGNTEYPGWAALRKGYNVVEERQREPYENKMVSLYGNAAETIFVAFVFFSVFGFGEVARSYYAKVFREVASLFGRPVTENSLGPTSIMTTITSGDKEAESVTLDMAFSSSAYNGKESPGHQAERSKREMPLDFQWEV